MLALFVFPLPPPHSLPHPLSPSASPLVEIKKNEGKASSLYEIGGSEALDLTPLN